MDEAKERSNVQYSHWSKARSEKWLTGWKNKAKVTEGKQEIYQGKREMNTDQLEGIYIQGERQWGGQPLEKKKRQVLTN